MAVLPDPETIKRLREERGWSQLQLADEAIVATGTVENLELGKPCYPRTLKKIAEALDRPVDELLAGPRHAASPSEAPRTATPLYNVPAPVHHFVGREAELRELHAILTNGHVRLCAAVEGLAGIGKTELALQLVHQLAAAGEFTGGVFWFDAENPDLTTTWGSERIAGELDVQGPSAAARAEAAVSVLRKRPDPILIVLDNVESWDDDLRPRPLPNAAHVTVLATTRRHSLGGSTFRAFELDVLARSDAASLLGGIAGSEVEERPGSDELLQHLDGHTLAVEIAGAYLRETPGVTPADYLELLTVGAASGQAVTELTRYRATVDGAFSACWDRMDTETRAAWQVASCFAPESASLELAAAAGLDATALRALRRWHLISYQSDDRWGMHRLTREHGRRAGTDDERRRAVHAFVDGCRSQATDVHAAAFGPDRAQHEAALSYLDAAGLDIAERLAFERWVARGRQELGELKASRALLEASYQAGVESVGREHPEVASALSALGWAHYELTELARARTCLEEALALEIAALGEDGAAVALTRSRLGVVYSMLGDYARGRDLFQLSLDSDLRRDGEDGPTITSRRANLAIACRELDDLPRARELLEQCLASDLRQLGEEHRNIAERRTSLGLVLWRCGEWQLARQQLESALRLLVDTCGDNHPRLSFTRQALGRVLRDLGQLDEARELLELALESDTVALDPSHLAVLRARHQLALVHHDLGDLGRARTLLEPAIHQQTDIPEERNVDLATFRLSLAAVLRDLGELERSWDLLEQVAPDRNDSLIVHRTTQARILRDRGDLVRARELLHHAVVSGSESLGESHPHVTMARSDLGLILSELGDLGEARDLLESALEAGVTSLGSDHPTVGIVRARLAAVLALGGDGDRAKEEAKLARRTVHELPTEAPARTHVHEITDHLTESPG